MRFREVQVVGREVWSRDSMRVRPARRIAEMPTIIGGKDISTIQVQCRAAMTGNSAILHFDYSQLRKVSKCLDYQDKYR